MGIPEERARLNLIAHAKLHPQVLDLPDTDPWMLDYNAQFVADLPAGCDWIWRFLPKNGPAGWEVHTRACDGYVCTHGDSGLIALLSGRREDDGRDWLHLSLAHPARFVMALELPGAKDDFFGKDSRAIVVLPEAARRDVSRWGVEHVFWCPGELPTPNFARIATAQGEGPLGVAR